MLVMLDCVGTGLLVLASSQAGRPIRRRDPATPPPHLQYLNTITNSIYRRVSSCGLDVTDLEHVDTNVRAHIMAIEPTMEGYTTGGTCQFSCLGVDTVNYEGSE